MHQIVRLPESGPQAALDVICVLTLDRRAGVPRHLRCSSAPTRMPCARTSACAHGWTSNAAAKAPEPRLLAPAV